MADQAPPGAPDGERPLGLAGFLEEDVESGRLMGRVHRSIQRRELSGQAVDFAAIGLTGVLLEYLRAIFGAFSGGKGTRRVD
jgi:hypothetical protein